MAAALSTAAIELSELRGGCWEAAAFARADATLGSSLIELALHESAEARLPPPAPDAPPPPPPRGGTDVAWLLGADAPAAAEVYGDVGAILDEVLTGTLPALSHRSAGLAKCCLTELYAVTPRLRALLSSLTPPERAAGGALTASLFSLVDELAAAPPSWPLPAGAKGWVALQHGDLQAAHVFADARGRCWLLRGAHRAGPAHALSDLSKLCASLLFLGSALPLSRADLRGLPPWRIAAQLRLTHGDAKLLHRLIANTSSLSELQRAVRESALPAAAARRVLLLLASDSERAEAVRQMRRILEWVATMPPLGGADADDADGGDEAPPPEGVTLPPLLLAWSYLQQCWQAAARLCAPPGARKAAAAATAWASSAAAAAVSPDPAAAAAALERGWAHPSQLVLPLLTHAARMARYAEATAPQREVMLDAARILADALRREIMQPTPLVDHPPPSPLTPSPSPKGFAIAVTPFALASPSTPSAAADAAPPPPAAFESGQRLLVRPRGGGDAAAAAAGGGGGGDVPERDESGGWSEGFVDANGLLQLAGRAPLRVQPLFVDVWEAPLPLPYANGTRVALLTAAGWEEWRVGARLLGGGNNLFVLESEAEWGGRCVALLTQFNHRVDRRWPRCEYQHRYAAGTLLRGVRGGQWRTALSLGSREGGEWSGDSVVRLHWGQPGQWADRRLSALDGHTLVVDASVDLELEHSKLAAALAADAAVVPDPAGGAPLDALTLAFELRHAPAEAPAAEAAAQALATAAAAAGDASATASDGASDAAGSLASSDASRRERRRRRRLGAQSDEATKASSDAAPEAPRRQRTRQGLRSSSEAPSEEAASDASAASDATAASDAPPPPALSPPGGAGERGVPLPWLLRAVLRVGTGGDEQQGAAAAAAALPRAVLVVGGAGAGKTALCRALIAHAVRDRRRDRVPLLLRVADVAAAVRGGALRVSDGASLVLGYLRVTHGAHSRHFALMKQALHEGRLLLILDGLGDAADPPAAAANGLAGGATHAALQREIAGLLCRQCALVVTARPKEYAPAFFPQELFLRLALRPPRRAAAVVALGARRLAPPQLDALRRTCTRWGQPSSPLLAALLVGAHTRRPPAAPPLAPADFFEGAVHTMLHAAAAAARALVAPEDVDAPAAASGGVGAAARAAQLRLHVLKLVATHAFGLGSDDGGGRGELTPRLVEAAVGKSAGALQLWSQLRREALSGALPLLVAHRGGALAFADARFADVLVALRLRDLTEAQIRAGAAAPLLAPPPPPDTPLRRDPLHADAAPRGELCVARRRRRRGASPQAGRRRRLRRARVRGGARAARRRRRRRVAARVLRGGERRGAPLPARVVHRRGEGRDRRTPLAHARRAAAARVRRRRRRRREPRCRARRRRRRLAAALPPPRIEPDRRARRRRPRRRAAAPARGARPRAQRAGR